MDNGTDNLPRGSDGAGGVAYMSKALGCTYHSPNTEEVSSEKPRQFSDHLTEF